MGGVVESGYDLRLVVRLRALVTFLGAAEIYGDRWRPFDLISAVTSMRAFFNPWEKRRSPRRGWERS